MHPSNEPPGPSTPPRTPTSSSARRPASTERRRTVSVSGDAASPRLPLDLANGGGGQHRSVSGGSVISNAPSFSVRPSGRKWLPTLDPVDTNMVFNASSQSPTSTSSPRHAEHHGMPEAASFTTARSPITGPDEGATVHRRRMSTSNPSGNNPVSRRRFSVQESQRPDPYPRLPAAPLPAVSASHVNDEAGPSGTSGAGAASSSRPAFGWFSNNPNDKRSKSDDEREMDDKEWDSSPYQEPQPARTERRTKGKRTHRSAWHDTPSISMTPPASEGSGGFMAISMTSTVPSTTSTLAPLPQDPYNLLPLSASSTPPVSRRTTPLPSPQASMGDLAGDYVSVASVPAGNTSGGGTSSPRTSMSTSSSHFGWGAPRSFSESSTGEDDDGSPTNSSSWWWRSHPRPPPIVLPRPTPIRSAGSRVLSVRRWAWLLGPMRGVIEARSSTPEPPRYFSRRRRGVAAEKLISTRRRRHPETICGSERLGTASAYVKTKPWTVTFSVACFAMLVLLTTLTIKHILNPDKEALPWRQYCTAEQPTLYSLQPSVSDGLTSSLPYDMTLSPITPDHRLWPYPGQPTTPYSSDMAATYLDEQEPVSILVGVFTVDQGVDRRNLIRQSYASHWRSRKPGTEGVRVRFVMGRPRPKYARAVALEVEAFNDIILLDIPENMNSGKTHAFFSWAAANATVPDWEYPSHPRSRESEAEFKEMALQSGSEPSPTYRGERKPDYVVKADDDSFIMLGELERKLRAAPRTKAYWGYLVRNLFMAGECYALSRDLVDYVAHSAYLLGMTKGKEDKLVSKWMRHHPEREDITWVTERCWIYDHPRAGTVYAHGFLFPNEVTKVRAEQHVGLPPAIARQRGGEDKADAYSTVSKFSSRYSAPARGLSTFEQVEALVEGSGLSQLRDDRSRRSRQSLRERINQLVATRPTRSERFNDDLHERGGTVVVHYIKRDDWYVETMAALLGAAGDREQRVEMH